MSDSQRGELEGIVLRLSNAYGAPVHKDVNCWMLLANDLCQQAVKTKKMILKSNGLQHRDFVSMAEVCCVIESFSTCDIASSIDRIFNVGSGSSQSVREMGQLIQDRCKVIFGYEPELSYQELRRDESYEELDFSQVRRRNMTAVVDFKNNIEIDNLLVFCSKSFNQDMGERL